MEEKESNLRRIWLANLQPKTTEFVIMKLVCQFGQIEDFNFPIHKVGPNRGSTIGYCFITFKNEDSAQKCIKNLNGLMFHGTRLSARLAKPSKSELEALQSVSDSIQRQQIEEDTAKREAELAQLLISQSVDNVGDHSHLSIIKPITQTMNINQMPNTSTTSAIPDLYGKLGLASAKIDQNPISAGQQVTTSVSNRFAAMNRIKSALRLLEQSNSDEGVQPALLRTHNQQRLQQPHPAVAHLLAIHRTKQEEQNKRRQNRRTQPYSTSQRWRQSLNRR